MSSIVSNVRKVFPWLLLSPVLLPLVISKGLFFPFLVPKTLFFYAVGLLTLAAFTVLKLSGMPLYFGRLKSWKVWIPALLVAVAYVTSLLGVDFYRSFWSVYNRGDGLLMLTLSVASFYMIVLSVDSDWVRKMYRGVGFVASLVGLWGVIEWIAYGGERVQGPIGNAAFLAGYLGVALFITLIAAREMRGGWRTAYYIGAALQFLAIVFSATRGTMLALIVVGFLALVYGAIQGRGAFRTGSIAAVVAILLIVVGFVSFRTELAHSSFRPVARIANTNLNDQDVTSRLFVWKNITSEIEKRPLTGYGGEHIDVLFNKFYDPSIVKEEWFDRAHNAYLDYAAQYGILGTLLYLALIALLLWGAYRLYKTDRTKGLLIAGAAITYAIQNFFAFDTISSWWLFLALLAVTWAELEQSPATALRFTSRPLGIGLGIIFVLLVIPCSILPLIANRDIADAFYYHVADVTRANSALESGYGLHTYGNLEYGYEVFDMYTNEQATMLSGGARVQAFDEAKKILAANYEQFPYDAHTALAYAQVLSLAPPEIPSDPALEKSVIQHVIDLSPKRSQPWYMLANFPINEAKAAPAGAKRTALYKEAIQILESYVKVVPNYSQTHYVLANLYLALGDTKHAALEADLGFKTYDEYLFGAETARRAAGYYEDTKDWAHAKVFLQSLVNLNPKEYASYYDLAKVDYLNGDPDSALKIVQELRLSDPDILATDPAFLTAITTYEQQKH